MRSHKSTILIALMALLLSAFVAVMGQQSQPQTDQKKQAEACCEMESCCCKGDSCPLKKEGATNADAKDACCCSSGGCDMKAVGGADVANAATAGAKHACCGDSCDMMAKHDPTNPDMAKHDPAKHDMAKHDKKSHADGSCCNAKQKDAKNKEMNKQPAN